jgi:hypothetical protein
MRMPVDVVTRAVSSQDIHDDFGDARTRSLGHQNCLVGGQHRFIDIAARA